MLFCPIETPGLAHRAYILADQGQAMVVDPRRDVDDYLEVIRNEQLTLRYVLLTHRQEDFVVGTPALVRAGASIVSGPHERFGPRHIELGSGHQIELGSLRIRALHTPGHTPESMSYVVYTPDTEAAWGVFTGDALFFGSTGRVDLDDADSAAQNAGALFDALHRHLAPLGDQTMVFPAHGPGSVCGSGFASRPMSTVGLERATNPVFTLEREAFVRLKVKEHHPKPPHFEHVHRTNGSGGASMPSTLAIPPLRPRDFEDRASSGALVIDTRSAAAFAGGHISGAVSVWLGGLPVYGGFVASADRSILLVTERPEDAERAAQHLMRIGIDRVEGVLAGGMEAWQSEGRPLSHFGTLSAQELHRDRLRFEVLDVRRGTEVAEGRIRGARFTSVERLAERDGEIDLGRDRAIAVTCSVGHRGSLAASLLARRGFTKVHNLLGGMKAWNALGLPTD